MSEPRRGSSLPRVVRSLYTFYYASAILSSVFRFIVIVNVITQTLLTATLTLVNYINGSLAAALLYIVLETAVFLLEGILYAKCLKLRSECPIPAWKPWIYAWVANTASFFAGVYLMLVTG